MVWLLVFLAMIAFAQAFFLFPVLFDGGPGTPVVNEVNLPEREVRVFHASGSPSFLLKTTFDLPEADRLDAGRIDAELFPGGERHVYYLLYVQNDEEDPVEVDLAGDALVLEGEAGRRFHSVPLAEPLAGSAARMPAFLAFQLRCFLAGEVVLRVPGRSQLRALIAFPADATPDRIAKGRLGDTVLMPVPLPKDALDRQIDRIQGIARARRS
jgi:hypothetical protein